MSTLDDRDSHFKERIIDRVVHTPPQVDVEEETGTGHVNEPIDLPESPPDTSTWKLVYRITKWMVALVILGLLAGFGLHAYSTYKTGLMTVERQCRATVPDKIEVNGVREYFYRYHEILGWRFYKRSEVKTRTFLVSSGGAWSVVGHTDPTWWTLRIKPGEMGKHALKDADRYTFIRDGEIAVIEFRRFCGD